MSYSPERARRALRQFMTVHKVSERALSKAAVKTIMPGKRRGRFTLESVNPAYPPMEDQVVVWAARIAWVKKAGA